MKKEKTKKQKPVEKKLKANQKLALERIYRLFELAQENSEYSKRYLQIAKRIGEKTRTQIPKELKIKYCKKCLTLNVKCNEEKPFLIVKCDECGYEKKYGAKG